MNRHTMHAISLWQPWASALFAPAHPSGRPSIKTYETRHWAMPDRFIGQRVAIHAAKRDTREEREFWTDVVMDSSLREMHGHAFAAIGIHNYHDLPRGAIIGTVVFGSSWSTNRMEADHIEQEWGNYSADRWAWPVVEAHHFAKSIPCIGRQGFFIIPTPVEAFGGILATNQ